MNDFLEGLCVHQGRDGRVTVAAAIPGPSADSPVDRMPRRKQDCPKRMKCESLNGVIHAHVGGRRLWNSLFPAN